MFRSIRYAIEDHVRNFTSYSQQADFVAWEEMSEVRVMVGSTYLQLYLLISDQLNVLPCDIRLWICEVPTNNNHPSSSNNDNYNYNNHQDHSYNRFSSGGSSSGSGGDSSSGSKVSFHDPYNDHPDDNREYSRNNWDNNYHTGGDRGNHYDLGSGGGGGDSNMGDTLRISDPLDFHSMCDKVMNIHHMTHTSSNTYTHHLIHS